MPCEDLEKRRESNRKSYKKYYDKNKIKINEQSRLYRLSHMEMFRKKARKHNLNSRMKLISYLGGKCVRCGFNDWHALQVDHINGNGLKELENKVGMKNTWFLRDIIKNAGKYQLLCANCNWIKKYENNENAHLIQEEKS